MSTPQRQIQTNSQTYWSTKQLKPYFSNNNKFMQIFINIYANINFVALYLMKIQKKRNSNQAIRNVQYAQRIS